MFNCFGCVKQMVWGDDYDNAPMDNIINQQAVEIDTSKIGTSIVVVKQGKRICGSGGALACAPIAQDKAYFEAKVQASGTWCVGLATKNYNPEEELGKCGESWALRSDGTLTHNGEEKGNITSKLEEGDVLGCTYDHVQLCFYKNGTALTPSITGIKGSVFPAFFVDDGATLDTIFTSFYNPPPPGFDEMMIEQDIL